MLTGPVNATTTTNGAGDWSICGLPAGNYQVHEVNLPGWINTLPGTGVYNVALAPGAGDATSPAGPRMTSPNSPGA